MLDVGHSAPDHEAPSARQSNNHEGGRFSSGLSVYSHRATLSRELLRTADAVAGDEALHAVHRLFEQVIALGVADAHVTGAGLAER